MFQVVSVTYGIGGNGCIIIASMRWCAVGEQHHHLAPFFKLISRNAGQHISGFAHAIVRSRGTSSMKFIYSSFDKFSLVFWVSTGNNNLRVVGVRHLRVVTIIMVSFSDACFAAIVVVFPAPAPATSKQ